MPQETGRSAPKIVSSKPANNVVHYPLKTDRNGRHVKHPSRGRINLIVLHCNCGRSIFVDADEASQLDVMCNRCHSAFQWQQLTFADLNAA
ncbi:MAG: hypothetical protein D6768_12390 [Chloroflexi bacterium]|nr:MAG: hypothetical protein D6768_12390 [Chloroflexota bacterium]